ncbi:hypothetical protein [Kutzneria kofuensis]|uniref:hypothetical protein n=1 Tax=Kutzneria kofuensis TaxID=103725 RepID=UPI0031EF7B77
MGCVGGNGLRLTGSPAVGLRLLRRVGGNGLRLLALRLGGGRVRGLLLVCPGTGHGPLVLLGRLLVWVFGSDIWPAPGSKRSC